MVSTILLLITSIIFLLDALTDRYFKKIMNKSLELSEMELMLNKKKKINIIFLIINSILMVIITILIIRGF